MASLKLVSSWRPLLGCCIFSCLCLITTTPGVDALAFLQKPPFFLRSYLGLNLKINCSTDDPNATVSLFHRKTVRGNSQERTPLASKVIKSEQVFTILSLTVNDAGIYTCKARNNIQSIEWPSSAGRVFLSSVQLPGYFVLKPDKPVIIRTGQEGKVVCESEGTSVASLQWKKQVGPFASAVDTPVPDSMVTVVKNVSTNRISATLKISNAKQDDAGTYKCVLRVFDKSATRPISVEVRDPEVPVIQPYTSPTTIKEGTEKFLKCTASAFPKPTITWYKDGQQLNTTNCITSSDQRKCKGITYDISEDDVTSQIHSFGKLKIQSALYPRDQGEFKCVASNGFYSAELVIVLDVQAPPRLIKNLNSKLVKTDEESEVVCTVERSNPRPTFQWKYQAMNCPDSEKDCLPDPLRWKSIPAEPSSQVTTNQSVVTVARDVQNTFYLCQAINLVGNDSQVIKLVRIEKVKKYIEMDPTYGTEFNEQFTLRLPCIDRCFFMCSNIHFTRDGKKLLPENDARINVTREQNDSGRVVLTIKNLTLNDSGNYRCVGIENPPLYDSVNITIKALRKPVIKSLIIKATYGKPVQLLCQVTANPPADITWSFLKDDGSEQTITESNDLGGNINGCASRASGYFYFKASYHSHLVICNPKYEDHAGQYTCHASNKAGSSSDSALLDVFYAPTIITPSDGFRRSLDFGQELNVTCTAKANPHATVMWITNTTDQPEVLQMGVGSVQLFISSVDEKDFKRYKCVAKNRYGNATAFVSVEKVGVIEFASDNPLLSTPAMVGIAVGVGLFVLLLLVVGCFLYRRQKKQMDEYKELYFLRKTDYKIDPDRSLLEQCNDLPYDPDWEFPEERLILGDVIGSGAFGQVIKAEAIGIIAFNPRDKTPESFKRRSKIRRSTRAKDLARDHVAGGEKSLRTPVAVKTLKEGAAEAEYKDLASELKILIHLGQHKNIINLLGACTRGKRLMVIMEFAPHGSFLSFIRAKREIYDATWTKTTNNPEQEFTLVDLGMAAYQISRGMAFLASKKCVHRDLAARNILVGSDYVMKIADFGLARDIYKNELYVKTTSGLLPVKWMAPESLFDRVYTEKTDVWSFGILLWEAFTLGGTPYPGLPTEELLDYLSEGKRMEMPARCPLELYTIMRDCWLHDPAERPDFTTINERLGKMLERNLTKDNPYIALQMAEDDEEEYGQGYYLQPCESGIRESKRYVESPVHTPDEEGKEAPRFDQGAAEADREDDTRYGSPLPPLPPGLDIISDDDIHNAPLPPIPASHEEALCDEERGDEFNPRRESGIDLDYAADSGDYINDLNGKSPDPSRDGGKPLAIQMDGIGKLPEVKTKGTRQGDETQV